jgi:hypothetical protein
MGRMIICCSKKINKLASHFSSNFTARWKSFQSNVLLRGHAPRTRFVFLLIGDRSRF